MKKLRYRWVWRHQGQYADGHKREDIIAARKEFICQWYELIPRMRVWTGDDLTILDSEPLPPGTHPVIAWPHDESTYYVHESKWVNLLLLTKRGMVHHAWLQDLHSALKSGLVSVLLPFLEGPRTGSVPESFRMQELWTGTTKNCKKPVETGCNWSRNEYNKTCAISVKIGHKV